MLEQKFLDRFDMERRIQSRLFCFGSGASDDDGGGGSDDNDNYLVEAGRGRTTSSPAPVRSVAPPQDDSPDPAQRLGSVVGIPPTLVEIAQSASPEVRAANSAANDAAFDRFFAQQPTVTNLGNVAAAPQLSLGSNIVDLGGEVFDANTGVSILPAPVTMTNMGLDVGPGFDVPSVLPPAPATVMDIGDEYDPFADTGRTAMDVLNYNTDDQSGPAGRIRPFGGLTREQQANLEARDDFVAKQILANQTAQPSGIPTTNLTGIYTEGNDPMGNVRGFASLGPDLPFLGQTQVYTGFGDNPFGASTQASSDETVPPVTNPLTGGSQCPDGYVFDEDLQACRRKTKRELQADNGTGGGSSTTSGDMFYRRTGLDDAPANLPSGFNFDDANRAFTQSFAYRPSFYRNPMDTTGFTKLL